MPVPFFAIGNDELSEKPKAGKTITCRVCGKKHKIEFGKSKKILLDGIWSKPRIYKEMGFYNCGKKTYLASVGGKLIYDK